MLVEQRYGDVRIGNALDEGHAEDTWEDGIYVRRQRSVSARDKRGGEAAGALARPSLVRTAEGAITRICMSARHGKVVVVVCMPYLCRRPSSRGAC